MSAPWDRAEEGFTKLGAKHKRCTTEYFVNHAS